MCSRTSHCHLWRQRGCLGGYKLLGAQTVTAHFYQSLGALRGGEAACARGGVVQSCCLVADGDKSPESPMLPAPGSCGCRCCQPSARPVPPRGCPWVMRGLSPWEAKLCHVTGIDRGVCDRDTRGSVLKGSINRVGRAVRRLR